MVIPSIKLRYCSTLMKMFLHWTEHCMATISQLVSWKPLSFFSCANPHPTRVLLKSYKVVITLHLIQCSVTIQPQHLLCSYISPILCLFFHGIFFIMSISVPRKIMQVVALVSSSFLWSAIGTPNCLQTSCVVNHCAYIAVVR